MQLYLWCYTIQQTSGWTSRCAGDKGNTWCNQLTDMFSAERGTYGGAIPRQELHQWRSCTAPLARWGQSSFPQLGLLGTIAGGNLTVRESVSNSWGSGVPFLLLFYVWMRWSYIHRNLDITTNIHNFGGDLTEISSCLELVQRNSSSAKHCFCFCQKMA